MLTKKQIRNYIQRQNAWINANNIKIGQTVFILRTHKPYTKGWCNSWDEEMQPLTIGKIYKFKNEKGIGVDTNEDKWVFNYPYTILLPLQGKPEDYEIKPFFWHKDKHYALVTENPNESDFYLQGNEKQCLRKNLGFDFDFNNMYDTHNKKGYYPSSLKLVKNSVVASTLKGIWLPTIEMPK